MKGFDQKFAARGGSRRRVLAKIQEVENIWSRTPDINFLKLV